MLEQSSSPAGGQLAFAVTALIAIGAIPLWLHGQVLYAGGVLALALASYLSSLNLIRQVRRANEQKFILDQQLIQSQKLASIGELSSGIAHEINNPLAVIGQEAEWIRHILKADTLDHIKEADELKDSLREIGHQVDRCREITHKLLDFARKKEPLIQAVDVNRLIEDMARLVEKEASHHNIRLIRDYRNDLPLVQTDPPLLRQVILNLLNNATYAIQNDGAITVTTHMAGDDCVAIDVSDTGCGISQENLSKIFDPFFTTKPPGKGTGLGLSICHGIITRLGGRIVAAGEVGKGATFTIRLPLRSKKGEI